MEEPKKNGQLTHKQKKTNTIVIAIVGILILFYVIGTISQNSQETSTKTGAGENEEAVSQTSTYEDKNAPKIIGIGDTIISETAEITINHVELSYDVLPEEKGYFYTHYAADSGQVYIDVSVNVKNTQKQILSCTDVMTVKADYNDGYTYTAFPVVEDSNTGFTYASIVSIDPLETKGMHFLIDCPQEVEETGNPLFLEFLVEKEKYAYTIR